MHFLDRMLGHDRWTTDQLMELSLGLSDEQLDREMDIGLRTLRMTFDHMLLATETWTGIMIGKPVPWEPRHASIVEMRTRHQQAYDQFESVARELVASGRQDETFVDHWDFPQSYGGTILHVIHHNVQHRGEVLHFLQRLGVEDIPEGDPQEWEHRTGRIQVSPGP